MVPDLDIPTRDGLSSAPVGTEGSATSSDDVRDDPRTDPAVSVESLQRVDEICERFERGWQESKPEPIEPLLDGWVGADRRALLRELLAIDLEYRRGRGEAASPDEYHRRFPEDGDLVRLVFSEIPSGNAPGEVPPFLQDHPKYRVVGKIGTGGMGAVYRAEHALLGRAVAIKVIRPELLADRVARDRFLQEAQSAARLNHPNIVTIYDAEVSPDGPFLVMECVEGTDLARIVRERGPLSIAEACEAVRQAADGLQDAFESDLVHRDLSPRNLMRTDEGTVKLLDFGLALVFGRQNPADVLGSSGMLVGSAEYMSPEQAENPAQSDVRSDIYSLGCVLWFLLTGQPPRRVRTQEELAQLRAGRPLPRLGDLRSEVPPELEAAVMRALAHDPARRFQTPQELVDVLAPFCEEGATFPARRRTPRWRSTAALALAAALAIVVWFAGTEWARRAEDVDRPSARIHNVARNDLAQRRENQTTRAIGRLETHLARHPHDAEAWALLAHAWNLRGDYGWELPSIAFPKALGAARKAVELDADSAEGHLEIAFARHAYECDWKGAEESYERALELNPKSPTVNHWHAWFLVQRKQFQKAKEAIDLAAEEAEADNDDELLIIQNNVGKIRYFAREFKEAVARHRDTLQHNSDFRKAHLDLGYALIELERFDDAHDEFQEAAGMSEQNADVKTAQAYAYARAGQTEQAQSLAAELEPEAERRGLSMEMAHVYAALDDFDEAFAWIDKALQQKSSGRAGLLVDPRLDPLRKDPRFEKALRAVGLGEPTP